MVEFGINWNITTVRYGAAKWFLQFTVLVHRDVTKREHPEAVRPFMPEVAAFARHNHFNVLHPILR